MNRFVIIRGPAGVGKTTAALGLQKIANSYYLSGDEVVDQTRDAIRSRSGSAVLRDIPEEVMWQYVRNHLTRRIIPGLKGHPLTIIDWIFSHRQSLDISQHLGQYGYSSGIIIALAAPINTCLKRNEKRKEPLKEEDIRDIHADTQPNSGEIVIETEHKTENEVIDTILEQMQTRFCAFPSATRKPLMATPPRFSSQLPSSVIAP